jgi:hypothetical protein
MTPEQQARQKIDAQLIAPGWIVQAGRYNYLRDLAVKTQMVAEVERCLSVVEGLEVVVSANLRRAARLRQSILQRAFSGGLL